MRARWSSHRPLLSALLLFWLLTAAMVGVSLYLTGGTLAYARDDTYIHMAIARSVADYGVWGPTRHAFASAASSILWPLLLAGVYALFGVRDFWPLLLNLALGSAVLVVLARETAPYLAGHPRRQALLLGGAMLLIPLPALTLIAMEHVLHVLLTLLFAAIVARSVAADRPVSLRLLLLSALLMATRYESAVLILSAAILFGFRRRWPSALLMAAAGALPVVAFGLYATSQGGLFFPNSILIKANQPNGSDWLSIYVFLRSWLFRPAGAPLLLLMLLLNLWALARRPSLRSLLDTVPAALALLFIAGTVGHAAFSDLAQLSPGSTGYSAMRYDAYLVSLGILATIANWARSLRAPRLRFTGSPAALAVVAALVLALPPFLERAVETVVATPIAAKNIYEQQVQMGRFLASSYNDATVIGNDIGAISYYSDISLIDYIGLGDDQVARLVVSGGLNSETLDAIATARQARVAILYDEWLRSRVGPKPDAWTLVGRWANDGSLFTAYEVISFYAVTPADVAPLRANLEAFQPRLPSDVIFGINPVLDAAGGP